MKGVRGIFRGSKSNRESDTALPSASSQQGEPLGSDLIVGVAPPSTARGEATALGSPQASEFRTYRTPDRAFSADRPSYKEGTPKIREAIAENYDDDGRESESDSERVGASAADVNDDRNANLTQSTIKSKHIATSAGTRRLQRIMNKPSTASAASENTGSSSKDPKRSVSAIAKERVGNVRNVEEVAKFAARVVLPPFRVDAASIGGSLLETYPTSMQQECLLCMSAQFESTGGEGITMSALQYPANYTQHKRSLGLLGMGTKGRHKLRFIVIARSTNRPFLSKHKHSDLNETPRSKDGHANASEGTQDYDAMFGADDVDQESINRNDTSMTEEVSSPESNEVVSPAAKAQNSSAEDEVSSFPVLVCLTLNADGTAPDIRKLVPLDQLTTVQDLHASVVQLAFVNGDTVRLDFSETMGDGNMGNSPTSMEDKTVEATMDKERFIWSLLQIHAMLCVSVVDRLASATNKTQKILPPLNVRNMDRAELQYVATVNGFLRNSRILCAMLERQRGLMELEGTEEAKVALGEMEVIAYDLMMGNFSSRVELFHSEGEKKDAEEVLNQIDWIETLHKEDMTTASVAERLSLTLQIRMRDLEAETCRRLIAWEDEKNYSAAEKSDVFTQTHDRDTTVDALALASLFKTLESLDSELRDMEEWLHDRAAAIKPLTDDCADIEEENRQLEQQWKSYDMLGVEMRRLLKGLDINEEMEKVLKNPASALVYDEEGLIDVDESDEGIETIYEAGKALEEAIEYPKRSGGIHLRAVVERTQGLRAIAKSFCTALAQIVVTVMEQFKTEVVAGSDYGKVSKSDTHSMIAKKIRDTQRKFQSSLLAYIKLIEILAALSPEMLPALRDAYSELVAEGILMKKRCKGYFQALPGRNAAHLNRAGKDIKDYNPNDTSPMESVNAPDIRATLNELLPVVAREAYFVSALFGNSSKELDGREKKRNFENARDSVDSATHHFRYYLLRACGIYPDEEPGRPVAEMGVRGDPLLCLVASIYLNEAIDNYVDREKRGGDHSLSLAYIRATILDLRKKADKQWVVWVDMQNDWIRSYDGVPVSGKRAGVFPSFARFPCYIDHLIQCCCEGRDEGYFPDIGNIKVINYYLQKMAATLIESLREFASRESTDQQYASNVMLMENTYYFSQSMKQRGDVISNLFAKQITKASAMCKESTDAYLGWMIKREFIALHELFSRVSKIHRDHGDREVLVHVPKVQFVKTLVKEADRQVLRERIGLMFSRMEKHLSAEGGLLPVAWKALVKVLYEWFGRWEKLSSQLYGHPLDPTAIDIVRIAKAAGGAAKAKTQTRDSDFGLKSMLALRSET